MGFWLSVIAGVVLFVALVAIFERWPGRGDF